MALERGKYGVEYVRHPERDASPGLRWIIVAVVAVAIVSFALTTFRRVRASVAEARETKAEAPVSEPAEAPPTPVADPEPPGERLAVGNIGTRGAKTRNLLQRLEKAERLRDVEMAVTTLEQLRALPAKEIADIDAPLARRLGALNIRRLFSLKSAQWVATVTVKRGDSASRIAQEHGSTLASLRRLNEGIDLERLKVGDQIRVMDHPRFTLVVRRAGRVADLMLNGKFFRRYALTDAVLSDEGKYETPARLRPFLAERGIRLAPKDLEELTMLLPSAVPVLVSEL